MRSEAQKRYYQKNKEKLNALSRKYYQEHKKEQNKYRAQWQKNKRKKQRESLSLVCPICGKVFSPAKSMAQKYCSIKCSRIAAYRKWYSLHKKVKKDVN